MSEKLRFYHITDLHWLTGDSDVQKASREIIKAAFRQIADDKEVPFVFVSGDLTQYGEDESHQGVKAELEKLKQAGKQVFITFATHDWLYRKDEDVFAFRRELREMYSDFGWAQAYDEFSSYSYAVKLCDGWRLLALNDDGNGYDFCGYSDEELVWIKKQLDDAQKCGDKVIAMTHHPVIPPNVIYPMISKRDMLGGYEKTGPFLCENGLKYLFVGHTHMQSIECMKSPKGGKMWQVNTASITQYPAVMRLVSETDEGLDVKTVEIKKEYCAFGNKSIFEKTQQDFDGMLESAFYSVGYDIPKFANIATGMSIPKATVLKFGWAIAPVGKMIYNLTFRKAGYLFCCPGAIDKSIAGKNVRDTLIRAARNIYRGNEDIAPGIPEHRALSAVIKRLSFILRKKMNMENPEGVFTSIVYDGSCDDWNLLLDE